MVTLSICTNLPTDRFLDATTRGNAEQQLAQAAEVDFVSDSVSLHVHNSPCAIVLTLPSTRLAISQPSAMSSPTNQPPHIFGLPQVSPSKMPFPPVMPIDFEKSNLDGSNSLTLKSRSKSRTWLYRLWGLIRELDNLLHNSSRPLLLSNYQDKNGRN